MKTIKELAIGAVCALIITLVFVAGLRIAPKYPEAVEEEPTEIVEVVEEPIIELTELEPVSTTITELEPELTELEEPEFIPLDIPLDAEVQEYLKDKCDEANIDLALVIALIDAESCFDANAKSHTGDYGLMQINKCNHKFLSLKTGATDFTDPYQNIDAGMWMLADLFEKYEEAEPVLMAYHFGEGGAKKLWAQGKYTSAYSQAILEKQLVYAEMIEINV